ncbi:hypothetical protein C8R45DRAFT_516450 [Mycena sanguinolenta]|nr:hypothetical protein C8R45DRAFT_516450 [Mycena sanguinolenta]
MRDYFALDGWLDEGRTQPSLNACFQVLSHSFPLVSHRLTLNSRVRIDVDRCIEPLVLTGPDAAACARAISTSTIELESSIVEEQPTRLRPQIDADASPTKRKPTVPFEIDTDARRRTPDAEAQHAQPRPLSHPTRPLRLRLFFVFFVLSCAHPSRRRQSLARARPPNAPHSRNPDTLRRPLCIDASLDGLALVHFPLPALGQAGAASESGSWLHLPAVPAGGGGAGTRRGWRVHEALVLLETWMDEIDVVFGAVGSGRIHLWCPV